MSVPELRLTNASPTGWVDPLDSSCDTTPEIVANADVMATAMELPFTPDDADPLLTFPAASRVTATVWDCRSARLKVTV